MIKTYSRMMLVETVLFTVETLVQRRFPVDSTAETHLSGVFAVITTKKQSKSFANQSKL